MDNKELMKIDRAIETFSVKMICRMRTKMLEGFSGWDDEASVSSGDISKRMKAKASKKYPSTKDLIDIANFAMILFHRRNTEAGR